MFTGSVAGTDLSSTKDLLTKGLLDGNRLEKSVMSKIRVFLFSSFLLGLTLMFAMGLYIARTHGLPGLSDIIAPTINYYCDRQTNISDCLCYKNEQNASNLHSSFSESDSRSLSRMFTKCALTFAMAGRLGNALGQYATLYALAQRNQRPAFMLQDMANLLKRYFHVTLPVMSQEVYRSLHWKSRYLKNAMEDSYTALEGQFVLLIGYTHSWTFYNHIYSEIVREFTFHQTITDEANRRLRHVLELNTHYRFNVTFVGVHVRRTDFIKRLTITPTYLHKAIDYFIKEYTNVVFILVSDDLKWTIAHVNNSSGNVFAVGDGNIQNPIVDFATLVLCNHTVITAGSFGYWAAYLGGGDVVYYGNNNKIRYDLSGWTQIN